jgi:hypothetical protein
VILGTYCGTHWELDGNILVTTQKIKNLSIVIKLSNFCNPNDATWEVSI